MMKKAGIFALTAMLTLTAGLSVGCSQNGTGVALDYSVGAESNTVYDRELFFNNNNETVGADPGVFYLSEEEDEAYGGYYYMYTTGSTNSSFTTSDGSVYAFQCFRSKNLSDWQRVGTYEKGYSLKVTSNDWADGETDTFWAPEVLRNPTDGKYYMYFSASAKKELTVSKPNASFDRLYIGIAVGDTPVDFRILGSEKWADDADGNVITGSTIPVNFQKAYGLSGVFSVIDANPFLDDDGTLYLYFNKHTDSNSLTPSLMGVWGIKMRDFVTPDYSTISLVCTPNVLTSTGGLVNGVPAVTKHEGNYPFSEGSINEAPCMVKHNGKYYMTYSANGYSNASYSVHQAISDSPLGTFTKPLLTEGNPVLASTKTYVSGTGHHSVVKAGDDYMIVYARMGNPSDYSMGWFRIIGADRLNFIKNDAGNEVLVANGPSYSLQPLPESISGYKNQTETASITAKNGSGAKYLNDGVLPYYTMNMNWEFEGKIGTEITLSWSNPVNVSAIMIYNSHDYNTAFKDIKSIKFYFAEKPSWLKSSAAYAEISGLEFPSECLMDADLMLGSAAVAEFDELKVTKIVITLGDKYEKYDRYGNVSDTIHIGEIVCLGKGV